METALQAENSDVLPVSTPVLRLIAVTTRPRANGGNAWLSDANPAPSVVTRAPSKKDSPSPNPDGSHAVLSKS